MKDTSSESLEYSFHTSRLSGIILHPTSLPGPDGIGDIGPEAYRWIDFLSKTDCNLWQMLPLGPTGYGDSPYQCFSAFAGNPMLISPALLLENGLISRQDLSDRPDFPNDKIIFEKVIYWKHLLLQRAINQFKKSTSNDMKNAFEEFQQKEKSWLDDYALFMSIKKFQEASAWSSWKLDFRQRKPDSIESFRKQHAESINVIKIQQFLFFSQWTLLKQYANDNGVKIIGDVPIFIAYDSADAWSHPELFTIDDQGKLTFVAGVPPDYFSETGQLWGNPLYRWNVHQETNYSWWIERMKSALNLFDIIRLDHFRGFAGYWQIPAGMPTAEIGTWEKGPGAKLFNALNKALGNVPIIAEDLGVITPDVIKLRQKYNFPGMKIFQFAFSKDSSDPFLPHNYPVNCVAYTGTHDNDTVLGWYQTAPEVEKDFCRRYMARSGSDISWDMIRAVWSSVAVMSLAPIQDFLSLDTEARMNFPGKPSGNWNWRMKPDAINHHLIERIKEINWLYGRGQSKKIQESIDLE